MNNKHGRYFQKILEYKERFRRLATETIRNRLGIGSLVKEAEVAYREVLEERGKPAYSAWESYENGSTLNQVGSEGGVIIQDDVYQNFARITLERDSQIAPFAITCGIFGWMVHTRYFATLEQAGPEFKEMKKHLVKIVDLIGSEADAMQESEIDHISLEINEFVEVFP